MLKEINKKIGNSYLNCSYAVCDIEEKYSDILLRYGNPLSKCFNRKKAILLGKKTLIEINRPEDNSLVSFIDNKGSFFHVGIYFQGYIYHQHNDILIANDIDTINNIVVFKELKFYKLREVNND